MVIDPSSTMTDVSLVDHVFAVLLAVVIPVWGYLTFPRVRRRLAEDKPGVRIKLYRRTIIWQWTATALLVTAWLAHGRDLPGLGFRLPVGTGGLVALGLSGLVIALMVKQALGLRARPELHAEVFEQLDKAAPFLPRDDRESSWFFGTALTAGFCEEVMFRGFLLAYAASWLGLWGAVVGTSLAFGIGHLYQGRSGAIKTTVAGLVGGSLFVLGGTLLAPILLHAFVDVHGGMVYRIVRR
jgi:membrane protease YdiL (CAAX protease family)